jgi:oligopeptide/dipeptide ABC transporter ATP-binding protein
VETLLEVKNIVKHFPVSAGGLISRKRKTLKAVDGISFSIPTGTSFGIAGESGSGKTTVARLILMLEKATSGTILLEGKDVLRLKGPETIWYRTRVQPVFQDAASSLDPRMRVSSLISEPMEVQHKEFTKESIRAKTEEITRLVGLTTDRLKMFPHELSGGQKQRVAIARAIAVEPSLVILDEPVSSLDVSIRAQILNLLADIQERKKLTYLIIAHDLAMMRHVTNQIAVMYLGKIVEMGNTDEVFSNPLHPYTKALFSVVPRPEPRRFRPIPTLKGEIVSPIDLPPGCRFYPRCPQAQADCAKSEPYLKSVNLEHQVACILLNTS